MPELLLELFSEEIPARMQAHAARELQRLVVGALSDRGILFEFARSFAGPRRLTLAVNGLPSVQPDVIEERKGPRVGAPEKAVEGFLRSAGITLESCVTQTDVKGKFYVAVIQRAGRATSEVMAGCFPAVLAQMSWPKSMRWGAGAARWVRPLHRIVCTLDGELIPFTFAGVRSGNTTLGHRFLSSGEIEVRRFDDYESKLAAAHVVLDAVQRRATIVHDARQKAFALGTELIEDDALFDEVAGLVEWPVVLTGTIENMFMELPPEILQTSMRVHQRFLALRDPASERLSNRFLVVTNIVAPDNGKEVVAGNERVLRARLSDARFFWDQDKKWSLATKLPELRSIVFHANAGSMFERAFRMGIVARIVARALGLDPDRCSRAALLAKADLVTAIVGEFPELQGIMGCHYACHDGEHRDVANAIRDQYRPAGPADRVPDEPVAIVVALAEKIDTLVALWCVGERPTGSKDPFALRRAGLGIIRVLLENKMRVSLSLPMKAVVWALDAASSPWWISALGEAATDSHALEKLAKDLSERFDDPAYGHGVGVNQQAPDGVVAEVVEFLADRLKFALRDEGVKHDLIDAVFSIGGEDDIARLLSRVRELGRFLDTGDGANLLAAYRRAANILRIEEKRDGRGYDGNPDPDLFEATEERQLFAGLATASDLAARAIKREQFGDAMTIMAGLRQPVDAFFDKVTVNTSSEELRQNRLLLLARLRRVLHAVADFSRIEG